MAQIGNSSSDVIRQLHHRVKNNLQVICSLLRLQANYAGDSPTKGMFKSSEERVRSMALVHEKLCGMDDPSRVQFDGYISDLVGQLLTSYRTTATPVEVDLDLEQLRLPVEQAVPCGLLVNELVSNSLKHAQDSDTGGYLGVSLQNRDGLVTLEVRDRGPGLPEEFDPAQPKTLGLKVVQALSRQLGANVAFEGNGGATIRIQFKAAESLSTPSQAVRASA